MKKLIILLLTLTLILGVFASCQKRYLTIDDETSSSPSEDTSTESTTGYITESNETNQTENTETNDRLTDITLETQPIEYPETYNYTIKKVDGKWYMDFDSYLTPGIYHHIDMATQLATTSFTQLYNDIINNVYSQRALLEIIDNWRITEHGIPIINFDELYVPTIPGTMVFDEYILWEQETYSTSIHDISDEEITALLDSISKTEFENIKAQALRSDDSGTITDGRRILTESDKTIIVEYKTYSDRTGSFYMYVHQGNGYFRYSFRNFLEFPSDDFLLQFGAQKFQIPKQ